MISPGHHKEATEEIYKNVAVMSNKNKIEEGFTAQYEYIKNRTISVKY